MIDNEIANWGIHKGGKLGDSLFENGNPWRVQGGLDIGVGKYKVITIHTDSPLMGVYQA